MEKFSNIFESRGFVNNNDDWSDLCKYISFIISTKFPKLFKSDNKGWMKFEIVGPKRIFPKWINKITLKVSNNNFNHFAVGGIAAINDNDIDIINKYSCNIIISFNGDKLSKQKLDDLYYTLNHELQHAYLSFKSKSSLSDKKGYKISVDGGPDEGEYTYIDIYKNKLINGTSVCDLFKEFTYACHEVETSAFGREFNIFINKWFKTHDNFNMG